MWFNASVWISLFANDLSMRDGVARVKVARGDLPGAIEEYRSLLAPGPSRWVAVLEPRYILELARLLEETGDVVGAGFQYERFHELWDRADRKLGPFE